MFVERHFSRQHFRALKGYSYLKFYGSNFNKFVSSTWFLIVLQFLVSTYITRMCFHILGSMGLILLRLAYSTWFSISYNFFSFAYHPQNCILISSSMGRCQWGLIHSVWFSIFLQRLLPPLSPGEFLLGLYKPILAFF